MLVGAKGAGLFQETIHERGLAMINVRDDRDVSDVLHIVNDRFTHATMITAASSCCDRETQSGVIRDCNCDEANLPGRVGCGFVGKGQAALVGKIGRVKTKEHPDHRVLS